ncbi:MAG: Methylated-DNA--protein-cysteine methyltransferase [Nitrospira sp.]|nr:Methylated-DNA--protein-cysteine methyltransferase [Nitrospira sp.]
MFHTLTLLTETLATPIGNLMVISDEMGRLRAVDWIDYDDRLRRLLARHYGKDNVTLIRASRSSGLVSAIAAYFDGDLHAIDSLPTATEGTSFQKRVWQALCEISAGRTVSYSELARHIGKPAAVRAERKRWLLNHEKQAVQRSSVASASHKIGGQDSTMRLSF